MKIWIALAASLSVGFALTAGEARAQSGSLFGSSGLSSSGSSKAGLNGSSKSGSGGSGSNSSGVTGFSNQTAGSMSGFTQLGGTSFAGAGQTGFVGNRNASNTAADLAGAGGAGGLGGGGMGGGGMGGRSFSQNNFGRNGFGQNGFGQNGFGQNGQNFNSGSTANARVVRPQQRIAFQYTPRPQSQVQASVTTQLSKLPGSQFQGVNIAMDADGVVTLSGSVASEDDAKLAAMLAQIEPGVRAVSNDLVVAPQ